MELLISIYPRDAGPTEPKTWVPDSSWVKIELQRAWVKIFWAAKIAVMNGVSFDKAARKCQMAPDLYPRAVREQMETKIMALSDRLRGGNWKFGLLKFCYDLQMKNFCTQFNR